MAKNIYKFIFSIITTIMLLCAFCLSAFAGVDKYGINTVSMSSSASFSYDSISVYGSYSEAQSHSSGYVINTINDPSIYYDNYILLKGVEFINKSAEYSYTRLYVTYDNVTRDPDDINYIQFDFSYLCSVDVDYPSLLLFYADSNIQIPESDYTLTYLLSDVITPSPPLPITPTVSYKTCQVRVLFNQSMDFSGGLRVGVNQYVFNFYEFESSQIYGFTDLKVGYTTTQDYLVGVSSKLDDLSNKVTIMTDLQNQNNQVLTQLYDVVNTDLTTEQREKLTAQTELLKDIDTQEAATQAQIEVIKSWYEDYEYDFYGNNFDAQLGDYIDTVFGNDDFSSFWFGLWSHSFVYSMMIVVLGFAFLGFVVYGLR